MEKAFIFDMDGTLFETESIALQAFSKTYEYLKREGLYSGEVPRDEILLNQMGKTAEDFWKDLLPGVDEHVLYIADRVMFQYEQELIQQGVGRLYPGVRETLKELKDSGCSLFVASNGSEDYIQSIVDHFELNHFFKDLYSAGRCKTKTKAEMVRMLMEKYQIKQGYMIGDRRSDVEAGKTNGLIVIGCLYGFAKENELDESDYWIQSFDELMEIVYATKG